MAGSILDGDLVGGIVGSRQYDKYCGDQYIEWLESNECEDIDMNEPREVPAEVQYAIVYGAMYDGLQGIVGPFGSFDDAEEYMESHTLGHFEKFVISMEKPMSTPEEKLKRLTNPKTVEDYGLVLTEDELITFPEGRDLLESFGQYFYEDEEEP